MLKKSIVKQIEKALKIIVAVVLVFSTINFIHAQDNDIIFDVAGQVVDQGDNSNQLKITMKLENANEQDMTVDSVKTDIVKGIEYVENTNETTPQKEGNSLAWKNISIASKQVVELSYYINVLKDLSFDNMSWYVNDNKVKEVTDLKDILSQKDLETFKVTEDKEVESDKQESQQQEDATKQETDSQENQTTTPKKAKLRAAGDIVEVSTAKELKNAFSSINNYQDKTIKLMSDIVVTDDMKAESSRTFNIAQNVTLDLNGYELKVDQADTGNIDSLFRISNGAEFTLIDSDSEHGGKKTIQYGSESNQSYTGGIITGHKMNVFYVENNSSLVLNSGCLYDNGSFGSKWENTAIYLNGTAKLTVNESALLIKNRGVSGGAIRAMTNSELIINGGIISDNEASENGGAIFVNGASNVQINGATISNNTSHKNGGALCVENAEINVGNSGDNITVFKDNVSNENGGAIYSANNKTKILINDKAQFINNKATKSGGAIFVNDPVLSIDGAKISNNTANDYGGGLYISGESLATISNENTSIDHNTANSRGGGIYVSWHAKVTINNGNITENIATCEKKGSSSEDGGGGIRLDGEAQFIMNDGNISNNETKKGGGGGIRAGFYGGDNVQIKIYGGTLSNNASTGEGGAISVGRGCHAEIIAAAGKTIEIKNNKSTGDQDWGGGGLFCADGGTMHITNLLVENNNAGGFGGGVAGCSTGRVFDFSSAGGAIFDNRAEGKNLSGGTSSKNEDHSYTEGNQFFHDAGYQDYFCALNSVIDNKMLGGGYEQWTGSIDNNSIDAKKDTDPLFSTFLTGLTANPENDDKVAARTAAKVIVKDNSAVTHGGGILCNGYLIIGNIPENLEIGDRLLVNAKKLVVGEEHAQDKFIFDLLDNNKKLISSMSSIDVTGEGNEHEGDINIAIPFRLDSDEGTFVYYLVEKQTDGYIENNTVYKIVVKGITDIETIKWGTESKEIDKSVITDVEVTKGTFDENENFIEQKIIVDYTKNLGTGSNHAKLLNIMPNESAFINVKDEEVNISVNKQWIGEPKDSATVNLLANDIVVDTITLNESNQWYHTFSHLPKYNEDGEIKYTVKEVPIEGYLSKVEKVENSENEFIIKNTETTSISVAKAWIGPVKGPVQVQLYANEEAIESKILELNEDNNWSSTFENLPKFDDEGTEIEYTVDEVNVPTNYDKVIEGNKDNGFTIKNTNTEKVEISGSKTWKVPEGTTSYPEVTIKLFQDGNEYKTTTIKNGGTSYKFENLPMYDTDGTAYVYTVEEVVIDGYTSTKDENNNFTNTFNEGTTEVSGTKTWKVPEGTTSYPEVTIKLLQDEKEFKTTTIKNGGTSYKFENLPKYKTDGTAYVYTVEEVVIDGYTSTKDENNNFTNTFNEGTTEVLGTKTWKVPEGTTSYPEVTIKLFQDGNEYKTTTIKNGKTNYKFENLPKYKTDGTAYVYTVEEVVIDGYTSTKDENNNFTNTFNEGTIEVSGTKTWVNIPDDLKRPTVTIKLFQDGEEFKTTTIENGKTNYKFENLPKYKTDGTAYVYTVKEVAIPGYRTTQDGNDFVNTNVETIDISGEKTWVDNNNQDGVRPTSITIRLLADGKYVDSTTASAESQWKYSFTDLPKYANGKEIDYTFVEVAIPDYSTKIEGYDITNTHTPGKTSVTVSKAWDDANNQDGKRPTSVKVQLLADGNNYGEEVTLNAQNNWRYTWEGLDQKKDGEVINYTVKELSVEGYKSVITGNAAEGYIITNTYKPETININGEKVWEDNNNQDGVRPASIVVNLRANGKLIASKTISAKNDWKYSFTNLPKYENGTEIVYSFTEDAIPNYSTRIEGYDIINTHTPGKTSLTVNKVWNDANNQDGIRPTSIKVQLLANGKVSSKIVTLDDSNNWTYTWVNLDQKSNGNDIKYTVQEVNVDKYSSEITGDATKGYTITNTHTPATVNVNGTKTWNDNDNQDGVRPTSVIVNLFADGKFVKSTTVNANIDWKYSFTNLPKYNGGKEIVYTVTENTVDKYDSTVKEYNITNTHIPETTTISGSKTWDDNNNQDGVRPTSITVNLLANGTVVENKTITKADNWKYSFTDLPVYANGEKIVYTVTENTVDNYTQEIKGYDITNTHTPGKTSVTVTKAWDDANNQDGIRPTSVQVKLFADGVEKETVTLDDSNNWTKTWIGLDQKSAGNEIEYTVKEVPVKGYTSVISGEASTGYVITNIHETEKTSVSGVKTWQDGNNQENQRPTKITVNLLANGVKVASKDVTAKDGWKYSFNDLDKYASSKEIVYTITENVVPNYTTRINGYDITNIYTPVKVRPNLVIYKVDQDGNFLSGAAFQLIKVENDEEKVIGIQNEGPKFEFTNLEDGVYRVYETVVPNGYEGLSEPFEFEVIKGNIYYDEELTQTFTVYNTNDGTEPDVLGDEIDEEDYDKWVLGEEVEKKVKTSDDQQIFGYGGMSVLSIAALYILRKTRLAKH